MLVVRSRFNLYGEPGYPAINAHLHSILQHEPGGWSGFHGSLIQELGKGIQAQLDRDYPGRYVVDPTKAMQIRDSTTDESDTRNFVPDAVVFEIAPGRPAAKTEGAIPAPTLTLRALDTVRENEYLTALDIREIVHGQLGESITWIEVLSEANKVGGSGYKQYREKRAAAIAQGKSLVEFDFLHESSSPIGGVPSYRRGQPGATAYSIAVTDMRPLDDPARRNKTHIYGFGVDEPIPPIYIPLSGNEAVHFEPGLAYNQSFMSFPAFSLRVDYDQWPPHFESYQRYDRQRLALRRWLILNVEKTLLDEPVPLLEMSQILASSGRLAQQFRLTSKLFFDRSTGVLSWIGYYPDNFDPAEYIAAIVRCWVAFEGEEPDNLQVALRHVAAGNLSKVQQLCARLGDLLEKAASELEFLAQLDNLMARQSPPDE